MTVRSRRRGKFSIVDLTPLIDVVFLLLIFFMVSHSTLDTYGIDITLPEAGGGAGMDAAAITVAVNAAGTYFVNGEAVTAASSSALVSALQPLVVAPRSRYTVTVVADADSSHQSVVTALDACAQLGLTQVSLATAVATEDLSIGSKVLR